VLALHHGLLPPTLNQNVPDADCDLDYIPNTARVEQVDAALSNSFGFGGHNSVLAFRRWNATAPRVSERQGPRTARVASRARRGSLG